MYVCVWVGVCVCWESDLQIRSEKSTLEIDADLGRGFLRRGFKEESWRWLSAVTTVKEKKGDKNLGARNGGKEDQMKIKWISGNKISSNWKHKWLGGGGGGITWLRRTVHLWLCTKRKVTKYILPCSPLVFFLTRFFFFSLIINYDNNNNYYYTFCLCLSAR